MAQRREPARSKIGITAAILGALVAGAGTAASSCSPDGDDCLELAQCEPDSCDDLTTPELRDEHGARLGCSRGAGGDGGGGEIVVIPGCEGSPLDSPEVVRDACGLFVRADAAVGGNGTKSAPLSRIGDALAILGKRLYVCGQTFEEAIVLPPGVELFGSLDCASDTWAYRGDQRTRRTVIAPTLAGAIPLRVMAGGETAVYGVSTLAPAGAAAGASSIAALVGSGARATFVDCDLTAQNGADGAPGEAPIGTAAPGLQGNSGNPGCVSSSGVIGGDARTSTCGAESSTGGPGGNGGVAAGGEGSDGSADPSPSAPRDNGGAGQHNGIACEAGEAGAPGADGAPGAGAAGVGAISESGFLGASGAAGKAAGKPGQGGGGGGGARGATVCLPVTRAGPSGAGGGTGGCGGAVGGGGGAGGSSIGLMSLSAVVSLENVLLRTAQGGRGGAGNDGQPGGSGGVGGTPAPGSAGACPGGVGGQGGRGGAGGGGLGGHSLGIAFKGAAPTEQSVMIQPGVRGEGGPGGNGGPMNLGEPGQGGKSALRLGFE